MTIQPLSNRPREITVTDAIEPAYERVKQMLFRPFDFSKWIILGFCAWLAGLGESGGGGLHWNTGNQGQPAEQFRHGYHKVHEFVLANLAWIVPAAICLFLLMVAIWLVILWLNSRGKFLFLHCVALDTAEVDAPWHQFAAQSNSLFCFRIVVGLIGMVLCLPLVIFLAAGIIGMVLKGEPAFASVMLALGCVLGLFLVGIPLALVRKFTADFVVPIMYLRGSKCIAAWSEFWDLLSANLGNFVLYILFVIVLEMAIVAIIVAAALVTCCIAACILSLPFVGTVLLLPVLVFKRAYSLYYFAQYGPEYDVFPKPAAPPTPPAAPISPLGPVAG
jgi:hypothetical protein